MTDIIESHGPRGNSTGALGKRPWKVPCLIDLDDDSTEGMDHMDGGAGTVGNKFRGDAEGTFGTEPDIVHLAPS